MNTNTKRAIFYPSYSHPVKQPKSNSFIVIPSDPPSGGESRDLWKIVLIYDLKEDCKFPLFSRDLSTLHALGKGWIGRDDMYNNIKKEEN
jgi:hypothetical protein